jgi:hypothetical protein
MFSSELELQKCFLNHLNDSLCSSEKLFEEFSARFGNVDIIKIDQCGVFNISQLQASTLLTHSNAFVVALLHKNCSRTINFLIKKTGYTKSYILNIVNALKKANIIYEVSNQKYQICSDFKFPNLKFTSYELKLKDWRKAMLQAQKNFSFSSKSYVVMPDNIACNLYKKYLFAFETYNIGLIGVTKEYSKTYIESSYKLPNSAFNPMTITSTAKYALNI